MFFPTNTLNWAHNIYGIFKTDADLGGQDLTSSIQSSFMNCLASCASTVAWTHVSYCYKEPNCRNAGSCYLKYKPRDQSSANIVIGVQTAILNQSNLYLTKNFYF